MQQMAAEGQSDRTVPDVEVSTKQRCAIPFLHTGEKAPIDNQQHLLNVCGDQTVDVVHFSSGDSDPRHKPCRAFFLAGEKAHLTVVTVL